MIDVWLLLIAYKIMQGNVLGKLTAFSSYP